MTLCSISRKLLFRSFKGLQIDDWLMGLFVSACYTTFIVISNKYLKAGSNLEPPGFDWGALTAHDLAQRRYGSKLMIVVEQMLLLVIWTCKSCLLLMYHRLTRTALRAENIAIKLLAAYVALGFVVMEVLYFAAWCRPFPDYYKVPTDSTQCNTLIDHRITKTVFNITSDLIMLCIALQMLIRSTLPLKRKLVLIAIFSLGIFAVAAAVLSAYYSLHRPYTHTWLSWYLRESSTVIIVANMPFTWTLLRELFEVDEFNGANPHPWSFYPAGRTSTGGTRNARLSHQTSPSMPTAHDRRSPTLMDSVGSQITQSTTLVGSLSAGPRTGDSPTKSLKVDDHDRQDLHLVKSYDFATPVWPSTQPEDVNSSAPARDGASGS